MTDRQAEPEKEPDKSNERYIYQETEHTEKLPPHRVRACPRERKLSVHFVLQRERSARALLAAHLVHSVVPSCIRSFIDSFGRPLVHSFIRPSILHLVARSFIRSFVRSIVHSSSRAFDRSFTHSAVRSLGRSCIRSTTLHLFVRYSAVRSTTHLQIRDSVDRSPVNSAVLRLVVRSTTHPCRRSSFGRTFGRSIDRSTTCSLTLSLIRVGRSIVHSIAPLFIRSLIRIKRREKACQRRGQGTTRTGQGHDRAAINGS